MIYKGGKLLCGTCGGELLVDTRSMEVHELEIVGGELEIGKWKHTYGVEMVEVFCRRCGRSWSVEDAEETIREGVIEEREYCMECPSIEELEAMSRDGYCVATDGCIVEPDGKCPHNCPSWLLELGLI